jgi:hypothetical protein
LREDCDKEHRWFSQSNEQPYGEDDEPFASFGDPSRAMKSHSFTFRANVAHEERAHKGGADVDPVDASDAKTE